MKPKSKPENLSSSAEKEVPFWRDPSKRALVYQAGMVLFVALVGYILVTNTAANLKRQNIASGFGFLSAEASFEIGESLIEYSAADKYSKALLVGLLNTLKVSILGIVCTLLLGTFVGVSRLSRNWLLSRIAAAYIEVMQNIPVLLQLFFWYAIFYESFPSPRQALNPFPGVFLCNRGFLFGVPAYHHVHGAMAVALGVAVLFWWLIKRWAHKRQDTSGRTFPAHRVGIAFCFLLPLFVWFVGGAPTAMDLPVLRGFNFRGGASLSPEFCALLLGLVLYTSAFVAEIVRAGIQSVSYGQVEAAMALGLNSFQVLSHVVLPQAFRVIIPPVTSQMLNLIKNSPLAVAIGYSDFVSVTNTTINQTGQAIEGIVLIMVVYLTMSLVTSAFMNWYNKKTALVER